MKWYSKNSVGIPIVIVNLTIEQVALGFRSTQYKIIVIKIIKQFSEKKIPHIAVKGLNATVDFFYFTFNLVPQFGSTIEVSKLRILKVQENKYRNISRPI